MTNSLSGTVSVAQALLESDLGRAEARYLLQAILHVNHAWLIAHDQDLLSPTQYKQFKEFCHRRQQGEPVAYILGEKEFMGHLFHVNADVLIPRPETELLVERALTHLSSLNSPQVIDLGCGSGAIGISIALVRPDAQVWCSDISLAALAVAQHNAQRLQAANIHFIHSSWWDAIDHDLRFHLAVSNPPYIEKNDHHLQQGDLRFEPLSALTDHHDGLNAIRQLINNAPSFLHENGYLCIEHGWNQATEVRHLFTKNQWQKPLSIRDLADIERITEAQYTP